MYFAEGGQLTEESAGYTFFWKGHLPNDPRESVLQLEGILSLIWKAYPLGQMTD